MSDTTPPANFRTSLTYGDECARWRVEDRLAETTAEEQAAGFQAIWHTKSQAIMTITADGIIESFNRGAEHIFGYGANEVVGKSISLLIADSFPCQQGISPRLDSNNSDLQIGSSNRELTGHKADGTLFPLKLALSEIQLENRVLFLAIVHDNSELKSVIQQLITSNQELSHQSRDIEQFALGLRRSNEELSQFAYVASHDLQEPLRKIVAFCQALEEDYHDQLDETARGYIRYAVDGARRMRALMADLLTYSRVQTRGKPLEPTNSNDACDEAILSLTDAVEQAEAQLTRGRLPVVNADRSQLVTLFQQLIDNAIKYCGDRPRVRISAEDLDTECLFRVTDNGIGIDSQHHERIFVIFQRLHARDEYSGTGVGLAICKRIVERAGGRIWVESAAGAGCTFCFTLAKAHQTDCEK